MACRGTIDRVEAICVELIGIVDAAREDCDNDECELVNCVVHDCVQMMRRVCAEWEPGSSVDGEVSSPQVSDDVDRRVN